MRCLDVGCGGGEVTFDIATIVGQTGSVVGLDMDEVKLALARDVARQRGLSQVEFRQADVMTWTEPESFDMVYARALLQHVTDPVDMLSRMWAGVRPGGVLIAEDTDFERAFCEPPNDGFDFIHPQLRRAACQARRRRECGPAGCSGTSAVLASAM